MLLLYLNLNLYTLYSEVLKIILGVLLFNARLIFIIKKNWSDYFKSINFTVKFQYFEEKKPLKLFNYYTNTWCYIIKFIKSKSMLLVIFFK